MEDLGSFWTFQENVEGLQQKLQFVTYELEITRKQTNEELMKSNEHIKKLLLLLQTTCKERDEARYQLKKLQQVVAFSNKTLDFDHFITTPNFPATPFSPDSPLLTNYPPRANSNLSESNTNSFSIETTTTTNNNNNNFLVVDSMSHNNTPESNNNCYVTTSDTLTPPHIMPTAKPVDKATLIIEKLAKGRPRPKQGKLLQAVIEAGPLLQTLMVAGSLPRWRNPPGGLPQQIPPVQINNVASVGICQSSTSMLDFGGSSAGVGFDCHSSKRQRVL